MTSRKDPEKEKDFLSRLNPMKLIDSFSSAMAKSASFIKSNTKKDETEEDLPSGDRQIASCRIAVSCEEHTNVDMALYKFALLDKKTNEVLYEVSRDWASCEPIFGFIRSVCPKLEVPPPPLKPNSKTSAALVIEERRKHIQTFCNAAIAHPSASKLKELQELCGFAKYSLHISQEASQSSIHKEFSGQLHTTVIPQKQKEPSPPPEGAKPTRPRASSAHRSKTQQPAAVPVDASAVERTSVEECFRLMDVDNTAYITQEEMQEFLDTLPKQVSQRMISQCLKEGDKDNTGAYDVKSFRVVVDRMSQLSHVPVNDMIRAFRHEKFSELYSAIGEGASCTDADPNELRTLLFVIKSAGVRNITQQEVEKCDFSLPLNFGEFSEIMEAVTAVIPFDELFKSTMATRDNTKMLKCVNKYASKASLQSVHALKEKVSKISGATAKCPNCEKLELQLLELQKQMADRSKGQNELTTTLSSLQQQLSERDEQIKELSDGNVKKDNELSEMKEQLTALRTQLEAALQNERDLQDRLCETEAELDMEREKGSAWTSDSGQGVAEDEGDIAARCTLHFLVPAHLGTDDRACVIDLPGPLLYTLPEAFVPLGFTTDLYLCNSSGCEYMACRDSTGKRSCAWTIENECISFPWASLLKHKIPLRKWTRVSCRFYWSQRKFDFVIDDVVVERQISMRDEGEQNVATLDIFPRDDVLLCYANMHFLR